MTRAIEAPALTAPHILEYPYHRSTGPVIGRFLAALRDRRIIGIRARDGRVLVPPQEYDPNTAEPLDEWVEVADCGVVTTWSWISNPRPKHPLQRPFAWALVLLDGAGTAMLHVVDAADESLLRTGMRVRARWRDETQGAISDIECFVPDDRPVATQPLAPARAVIASIDPIYRLDTPIRLDYTYVAGRASSRFLEGVAEGRILGQRCPSCRKVYVPPRGSCPTCAVPTDEEVELADRGTVTTFCIVNLPFLGQAVRPPYASASILLEGADIPLFHLIQECPADDVRMGMRVEAVWVRPEERAPGMDSIRHFRPLGEPDAPYDSYKDHL